MITYLTKEFCRPPNVKFVVFAAATTATTAVAATVGGPNLWSTTEAEKSSNTSDNDHFRLEVHLMDKIAEKPYLIQRGSLGDKRRQRPKGVPETLRIMAVDLPEMRHDAFKGHCRVDFQAVFHDGVAPPKLLQKQTTVQDVETTSQPHSKFKKEKDRHQKIVQKSLAEALLKCRTNEKSSHVGIELLEVSIAELNPNNLRKTHSWGNYSYDPGKFARKETSTQQREEPTMADVEDDAGIMDIQDEEGDNDRDNVPSKKEIKKVNDEEKKNDDDKQLPTKKTSSIQIQKMNTNYSKSNNMVLATEDDEFHAPWNQYAWIEEISKRVSGKVKFGAPMEKSSRLSRVIFGNVYRQTVPSSSSYYDYFLPPFLQKDPCGIDGENSGRNWASQKPHAVIADGAAMQRVPGSAKYLTDCCREADVPLYIINDPRAWGGSTHEDLADALRDLRRTIKGRIVSRVVQDQDSGAFSRGKLVGQLQTETQWQAREAKRKTQQAIREATEKYKLQKKNDWSNLDMDALREKLVEHKLIVMMKKKKKPIVEVVEEKKNDELEKSDVIGSGDDNIAQESSDKPKHWRSSWWSKFGRRKGDRQDKKDSTAPPDASKQLTAPENIVEETSLQMTEVFRQLCREYFKGEEQKGDESKTETTATSVVNKSKGGQNTTANTWSSG
mmetsp:Transcript_10547/g.16210  ORF Transcript_10547/g.16210 Transcript_10547/m.16210 type:complete len:667 (+) Transcript_10547:232-2232(+)|eukprot:CAMPEP_0195287706 /NCGR_PEP_ID=MMETSP0707-20130614/4661_1 /TAXON_ID=33640 /ORGANISM="Asterionellopsis glacialis, Strain CCMP134" /LENGTH=666 /DNA_ID=CAMNT_0040347487 /DNA_START=199 /DNA_END=2199 /DNA_ORIENTATION=+